MGLRRAISPSKYENSREKTKTAVAIRERAGKPLPFRIHPAICPLSKLSMYRHY